MFHFKVKVEIETIQSNPEEVKRTYMKSFCISSKTFDIERAVSSKCFVEYRNVKSVKILTKEFLQKIGR
jgi:hypothetical protein